MKQIDIKSILEKNVDFIKKQLSETGFEKLIVGLSGGIDSAVTAALSVQAVGSENVYGVMMPYKNSRQESLDHALLVADKLNIQYQVIDITPMVDSYFDTYATDADYLRRGNRMARERMCILYDLSAKYNALVAGTGNRTELMIGYCTQYGDSACAFEPLGNLYKTEVKALAEYLDLPKVIIDKNPTADLWEGQTDEEEMGISYNRLDEILYQLLDAKISADNLPKLGYKFEEINKVISMIKKSEFKRKMPPQPE